MGDDNLLSQEEIDALMGSAAEEESGGRNGESTDKETLSAQDLHPAVEMVLKQAGTVLTTVLNKNTELIERDIIKCGTDSISGTGGQFKKDALYVKAPFENGIIGDLYYLFSKKSTALLADLMMMGDGSAEYEDDHKDALSELGNQIMGAVSTAMGSEFGISISVGQTQIEEVNIQEIPFSPEECLQANVSVKIDDFDEFEILLVFSPILIKNLLSHYNKPVKTAASDMDNGDSLTVSGSTDMLESEEMNNFQPSALSSTGNINIDMLLDVPLDVTIELGRSVMSIRKILELGPGSIVELDRKASEPVNLLVGDKIIAKGEVVVVDEYFGIRVVSLVSPEERIKHLR